MRRVVIASGVALAIVLAVMAYALLHDLLDGLRFTRSTESWGFLGAGLFLGGLVLILMETAGDWLFQPDEPWERRPRRTLRGASGLIFVALLVMTIALF